MKKNIFNSGILFLILLGLVSFTAKAHAMTPTLSLSGTGDGDSVQINVSGDANTSVLLFYNKTGTSGQQISSLGTTNSSGTLTTTISSSSYGVALGSSVYVATGSITGPQSTTVVWPAVASMLSSNNMLSLSQTGLVLTLGQSATVTASNLNSSSIFLSTNSKPQIANFNITGSQITVLANSYGSTTGTFCLVSNTSNCGSIYVIVQNSNVPPLSFSQSSVSISSGQTISIAISGGSGAYSVLSNASQNNGIVATNISSSNIVLTTTSTTGSSSITVCTTSMTSCGIINVTIGNVATSAVSFSQANPTLAVAQSLNISIFGPTNSLFYVASNTNPSMVQANISGSTLTLLGIANGSSVLSVCAATNNCGPLSVTVNSNSSTGTKLILSQDSVTLSGGQTANITISGGAMPYSILSNGSNLVQSSLNGNILTLYGLSGGSSLLNVCSTSGNCATLSITVNGGVVSTAGPVSLSTTPPVPITTTPVDCTGTAFSQSTGQACPASTIISTPVTPSVPDIVSTTPISIPKTNSTPSTISKSSVFKFTTTLKLGSTGTEVTQLQKKLTTLGFFKGKVDGKFGVSVETAVKAFQKAHKLSVVGSVGPQTRALLNK